MYIQGIQIMMLVCLQFWYIMVGSIYLYYESIYSLYQLMQHGVMLAISYFQMLFVLKLLSNNNFMK